MFVLPARSREGMPRALLEAAASARPLVVTDVPGCRHFVRDGVEGFVVPPEDADALANALERLARDPDLRRRMGEAARLRLLHGFTEAHVKQSLQGGLRVDARQRANLMKRRRRAKAFQMAEQAGDDRGRRDERRQRIADGDERQRDQQSRWRRRRATRRRRAWRRRAPRADRSAGDAPARAVSPRQRARQQREGGIGDEIERQDQARRPLPAPAPGPASASPAGSPAGSSPTSPMKTLAGCQFQKQIAGSRRGDHQRQAPEGILDAGIGQQRQIAERDARSSRCPPARRCRP